MTSTPNAETFKRTLQQIEQSHDAAPMAALFCDQATIDSTSFEGVLSGHDAILKFWRDYLAAFKSVHSTFTKDHTIGDTSVLQWVSEGVLPTGRSIRYRGVSIVTFKGYKVSSFTTYYDSAAFVAPSAEHHPNNI